MYHSEYEASAQGFRFPAYGSIVNAHRIAYPVACRARFIVALVGAVLVRFIA